jgi:hypothetical protein
VKAGFLGLETVTSNEKLTNSNQPELIRLAIWDKLPVSEDQHYPKNIRYIARFNDILAAQMHFHSGLRKHIYDVNNHIYKAHLGDAIAVIEANDDLRHERVWIDPCINEQTLVSIQNLADKKRSRKKLINRMIQLVGIAALGLLAMRFLGSFF